MLEQSFLQQLRDINSNVSDPKEAQKIKARLIGKWMQESPFKFFSELQERSPIFSTPLFTIVTHYPDVMEIFHKDEVFTIDAFKKKIQRNIGSFVLGMNNSPEYERQKSILRLAFSREDAALVRQIVIEESQRLLTKIATNKTFDLVSDYARLLPVLVMRRYLGLEQVPADKIMLWTRPIFRDIFANIINEPEIEKEASVARNEAVVLLDELVACRQEQMKTSSKITPIKVLDRFLSMQAVASIRLSNEEIRNCLLGFFVAVVDLTSIAIISALNELLSRPKILSQIQTAARQNNDEAIALYTWEALRFRPPLTGVLRTCTQDYILGRGTPHQTQIKAGTLVFAASSAAMHDQAQIEHPSEFRIGRSLDSYLFFESGLHTCLGKHFSHVQIPLAIKGLLSLGKLNAGSLQKNRGFPESLLMEIIGDC